MAEHEESSGGVPPLDEEAAWAAIVAGYGQEPPDPPGARPFRPIENLMLPEEDVKPEPESRKTAGKPPKKRHGPEEGQRVPHGCRRGRGPVRRASGPPDPCFRAGGAATRTRG
ncbi:hypothetical protein EF912_30195 [Streptomyces sp. WAC07061]|nr:hypothetical protein EF912_30195 [Streptomyces sp. WAC07061]